MANLKPIVLSPTMGTRPFATSTDMVRGIWIRPTACALRKRMIATKSWESRKNRGAEVVFNTHLLLHAVQRR